MSHLGFEPVSGFEPPRRHRRWRQRQQSGQNSSLTGSQNGADPTKDEAFRLDQRLRAQPLEDHSGP